MIHATRLEGRRCEIRSTCGTRSPGKIPGGSPSSPPPRGPRHHLVHPGHAGNDFPDHLLQTPRSRSQVIRFGADFLRYHDHEGPRPLARIGNKPPYCPRGEGGRIGSGVKTAVTRTATGSSPVPGESGSRDPFPIPASYPCGGRSRDPSRFRSFPPACPGSRPRPHDGRP